MDTKNNKIFLFLKKNWKYFFVFLFFFLCILLFGYNNTDNIWNYGMAHAIRIGEIPYKDFNIITTPLYPFIMSLFLLIWDEYIVFLLGQSLIGVICYYIIDKMIGNKSIMIIPFAGFGLFYLFFPNYNFLVMLLIVLLMYLENEKSNDYLIGLVLGLLVLTKHTMGAVIVICSLISTFKFNRMGKRIIGMIGPGVLFLLYLLITHSFNSFFNLSVMGLFDFSGHNNYKSIFIMILSILILLYTLYRLKKDYKNPLTYYLLGSIFFVYPIVDFFHFHYLWVIFLIYVLIDIKNFKNEFYLAGIILSIFFIAFNIYINYPIYKNSSFSDLDHFTGYLHDKVYLSEIKSVYRDYKEKDNAYMFAFTNMFYDIASNHEITYFDIPLYGNFGYNGVDSMINKVKDMHDVYFYVEDNPNIQYCSEIYDYIRESSVFKYQISSFEVYYKE